MMNWNIAYAVISATLSGVFLYMSIRFWTLFLVVAIYFTYKAVRKPRATPERNSPVNPPLGVIDLYDVDGDGDKNLGLYIKLLGQPVFVDLKEDKLVEKRKERARYLFENSASLEENLKTFLVSNPEFGNRQLHSIGIHSKKIEQGEVFWNPEGYTLLKDLAFAKK